MASKIMKALTHVVQERGEDYVYPSDWLDDLDGSCSYVVSVAFAPEPACIVGAALHHLGVDVDTLANYEGTSATQVLAALHRSGTLRTRKVDRLAAQKAQDHQDQQGTWGEALLAAQRVYEV